MIIQNVGGEREEGGRKDSRFLSAYSGWMVRAGTEMGNMVKGDDWGMCVCAPLNMTC